MDLHMNPELMVVGDSLAQGCRSLSVSEKLCSQSYSNIIAKSQGWDFNYPKFPRPVLFDLEQEINNFNVFSFIGGLVRLKKNIAGWKEYFEYQSPLDVPKYNDNLAVAGVSISEMNQFNSANRRAVLLDEIFPKMIDKPWRDIFDHAVGAYLGINSGFVLNPAGTVEFENMTQLDWVELRKPKRVIAHFGHNDGLYDVGGRADAGRFITDYESVLNSYKEVLFRLSVLPKQVQKIVVVLFPKISAVGNLSPYGPKDSEGYSHVYDTEFPLPGKDIKGVTVKAVDLAIKEFNRSVREYASTLAASDRFVFVDAYQILEKYDYKNTGEVGRQININRVAIDNRYVAGKKKRRNGQPGGPPKFSYKFINGGLFSLDGMHLSAIGYAMLACEIMYKMDLLFDKKSILLEAYSNEIFVSRYNSSTHNFLGLLDLAENFIPREESRGDPDLGLDDAVSLLKRVYGER